MSRLKNKKLLSTFGGCMFALVLTGPVGATECSEEYADKGLVHVDGTVSHFAFESRCFKSQVPSQGLLMVEVTPSDSSTSRPELHSFGRYEHFSTAGEAFTFLERSSGRMLLEIRSPGSFLFCVAAGVTEDSFEGYAVTTGFVSFSFGKEGDPKEEELEPDP